MENQYCPHCGSSVTPGSVRCATCGASLSPSAPSVELSQPTSTGATSAPPASVPAQPTTLPVSAPASVGAQQVPGAYPPYPPYPPYPSYPSYPPSAYPQPYPNAYPGIQTGQTERTGQPVQAGQTPSPAVPAPTPPATAPAAPGYPAYPQGTYPYGAYNPYAPYGGMTYMPYGGYMYPYANPWAVYYPLVVVPRRPQGETYALTVSWIVTIAGGLSIACGLLISVLTFLSSIFQGSNSLTSVDTFISFLIGPVVGGAFAIYYGIRGIQRKPSPRFTLPHPLLFLGLTVLVYIAAIIIWHLSSGPGPAFAALPLVILSAAMPSLTILSFTTWRLRNPTSRRHVWMSFIYGSTLAILIALILNTIGEVAVAIFELSLDPHLTQSNNPAAPDNIQIVGALLLLSVVAPLVEEGVKPLGTVLSLWRLRSPASAFLMGLAAGCGFGIFESVSIYIGQGQADWVVVALERVGSSLLHGVGAGMGALGWYYLFRGKGVRLRWWRGFGCLAYAIFQHGLFNGTALVTSLPGPVSTWLQQPVYVGQLPLYRADFLFFIYYAAILTVLIVVTGRLARRPRSPETAVAPAGAVSATGTPSYPAPTAVGGAR